MAATRYGLDDVSGYDPVHLNTFSAYIRRSNDYVQLDRHFEWVRVSETAKLRRLGVRTTSRSRVSSLLDSLWCSEARTR